MSDLAEPMEIELICAILNCGAGKKFIKAAKKLGFVGATATMGRGTVNNRILDFVGLCDIRKEIVFFVVDKKAAAEGMARLSEDFEFDKPNHGIAYTTSICGVAGTRCYCREGIKNKRGEESAMYHVITTIVDKGKAEFVIDAAVKAGSKGGTILNARGSGIHETSRLFSMDIEPEKEIVIILSESDSTQAIVESVRASLDLDKPGNGIIYVQDVNKTYGVYK